MAKKCTVPGGEAIAKGDAVCVIGFDTAKNRPTVKRATRDNLATSKTIFGVAKDNTAGGSVFVLVAGEVAENAVTSLGPDNSRIIATDIYNATAANQCRLIRIDRPDGSEFIVGTCDKKGNLAVQPRASRDTSNLHVLNVRSYGATGDGVNDDTQAIRDAITGAVANGSRHIHFPAGTYRMVPTYSVEPIPGQENVITLPSNFTVTGEGADSIIRWEGDVDGKETGLELIQYVGFYCQGVHDVLIQGLHFIGKNSPFVYVANLQSAAVSVWTNCSDVTVRGCRFSNLWGFSVHCAAGGPSSGGTCVRINVIDCVTVDCANGINVGSDYSIQTGNQIQNSEAFEFTGSFCILADNIIKNSIGTAISAGGSGGLSPGSIVARNTIDGSTGGGINVGDSFVHGQIINNTMQHCVLGGILQHEIGIAVGWSVAMFNLFAGNTIVACGGEGASFGMRISGSGSNTIVNNRIIDGDEPPPSPFAALSALLVASPNNFVHGNTLDGRNFDLVLETAAANTTLGDNHLVNGLVSIQGAASILSRVDAGLALTDVVEQSRLHGDNYPRFQRLIDGQLQWGPGEPILDTNLYRPAANQLQTDDEMIAVIGFAIGAQKIRNAVAVPSSGTWLTGDIVYNTAPVAGGFVGWVCTVSGIPGTWKTFGVISA